MDYLTSQTTNKKKYYLIGSIIIFLLLGVTVWFGWKVKEVGFSSIKSTSNYDYVIPGVPAINLFNHQGNLSYISPSDTVASTVSILEYWNPGANNFVEISSFLRAEKDKNGETIRRLLDGFYKNEYNFKREHLNINELKKYINSEVKTPLLIFFPLDKEQPSEVTFHPLTVVIGIKESEKKIVLHNFYLGNNYEISFADFEKSWESMRIDERDAYYVIQPIELKEKLKEVSSRKVNQYPARIRVMDDFSGLLADYAVSRAMRTFGENDLSMEYALKVKNDPRFEKEIHTFYKMEIHGLLASSYFKKDDLESAKQNALLAMEMNHDLNKPFKDWPGIENPGSRVGEVNKSSEPYKLLGDIYLRTNELDLAKQNYEKALEIRPTNNQEASLGLQLVNLKTSSKTPD